MLSGANVVDGNVVLETLRFDLSALCSHNLFSVPLAAINVSSSSSASSLILLTVCVLVRLFLYPTHVLENADITFYQKPKFQLLTFL